LPPSSCRSPSEAPEPADAIEDELDRDGALWLATYGGGIFEPIRDALAGTETYPHGLHVIDTVKGGLRWR
jgi:hypothetical protein